MDLPCTERGNKHVVPVHIHQNRVKPCPEGFTPGYYWYGGRRRGPGRPPKCVEAVLAGDTSDQNTPSSESNSGEGTEPSLHSHSLTDALPSEPDQDPLNLSEVPDVAGEMEETLNDSEDDSSTENHLDITEAAEEDSPPTLPQPRHYPLRTSRCPPEKYN